jgi:predicted O-methyltransferase YrrM
VKHVRPHKLFERLAPHQRDVLYHIPEMSGTESLTVFSLDTMILVAAARIAGVKSILEIGTSWGYNAFNMARNLDAIITTVDVEVKPRYAWYADPSLRHRIVPMIGSSHSLEPDEWDMVFVDGDHSYDAVRKDSEYALRNAQKVVTWHDYGDVQVEVTDYLDELDTTVPLIHIEDSRVVLWFKDGLL